MFPLLRKFGLDNCAYLIGEDGTSCQKRIDIVAVADAIMHAWGLNGGPVEVQSVEDLREALRERGMASTLYVVSIIPLVDGAPAFPLVVDANDNTFDRSDVHDVTMRILKIFKARGMGGRIVGGVSDGDSRLRNQQLVLQYHHDDPEACATRYVKCDHPFVQLRIPWIDGHGYYLQTSDWLHIGFRFRVLFLSDKRELYLGDVPMLLATLQDTAALGLRRDDTDAHDKQNWKSVLRWAGLDDDGNIVSSTVDRMAQASRGCMMYWKCVQLFLRIFLSSEPIEAKLEHCGYVLGFFALWRYLIHKSRGRRTMKQNFVTNQTFLDIVIAVSNFVLLVLMLRDATASGGDPEVLAQLEGLAVRLLGKVLSSRFLEYLFQFCRAEHVNAQSFGAYAGKIHVDHFAYFLSLEHELKSEEIMALSRRGVRRGAARLQWDKGALGGLCGLTNANVDGLIDRGTAVVLTDASKAQKEYRRGRTAPGYELPTISELKAEPLLSATQRKRVLKSELSLESPAGNRPGMDDSDDACDDGDENDDDELDDLGDRGRPTEAEPGGDADDGNDDDDDDESLPSQPLPSDRASLVGILKEYGLPVSGTVRVLRARIERHRSRSFETTAADEATRGEEVPLSKKATKRAENRRRFEHAIEYVANSVEKEPEVDGAKRKALRLFARLFNAFLPKKISRERAGPGTNRFADPGVRAAVPVGGTPIGVGAPPARVVRDRSGDGILPPLPICEMKHFIRLCKRLQDGGSDKNTRAMANALQISHSTGPLLDVKRRIELRMRAMEFEKNTTFIPTAEQAELSDTEFNDLVANETVVAVEYTIQRMVGILGDLVSQAAIPT